MNEPLIKVHDGATAWLTLNRPDKRNAMNDAMLRALLDALREAIANEAIRSIVVTGAGECFSAGRDLKDAGAGATNAVHLEDSSLDTTVELFTDVLCLLLESPKPTIAAVRGFAMGGGQAMTLACDFVVAESTARFGNVEIAYGFPAAMNAVLLGRHLGRRIALEIALTGTLRSAVDYQALGLVNQLCQPGSLEAATRSFVGVLNERAPWAIRRTKALMRAAEDAPLRSAMEMGNQLNQLLRLNNAIGSDALTDQETRASLRASVGAKTAP
jgi:enoyl-CoA hydratase/carnithine racemase